MPAHYFQRWGPFGGVGGGVNGRLEPFRKFIRFGTLTLQHKVLDENDPPFGTFPKFIRFGVVIHPLTSSSPIERHYTKCKHFAIACLIIYTSIRIYRISVRASSDRDTPDFMIITLNEHAKSFLGPFVEFIPSAWSARSTLRFVTNVQSSQNIFLRSGQVISRELRNIA